MFFFLFMYGLWDEADVGNVRYDVLITLAKTDGNGRGNAGSRCRDVCEVGGDARGVRCKTPCMCALGLPPLVALPLLKRCLEGYLKQR